jgi:hypothetical protein
VSNLGRVTVQQWHVRFQWFDKCHTAVSVFCQVKDEIKSKSSSSSSNARHNVNQQRSVLLRRFKKTGRAIFCQLPFFRCRFSASRSVGTAYSWRNKNFVIIYSLYTHRRRDAGKTGCMREKNSCKIRELIIKLLLTYLRVYSWACHLLIREYKCWLAMKMARHRLVNVCYY